MALKLQACSAVATSAFLGLLACGPSSPPSPTEPNQPTGNQVSGRERIGWDQAGDDASNVRAYTYWVYVDGVRSSLTGAECASTAGAQGFACSAPLPRLTAGQHTLELSAATGDGESESARSAPLVVVMVTAGFSAAAAPGDRLATAPGEAERGPVSFVTADGMSLVAREVAEVYGPTAIRFAPDGRLFVAEQHGRIRLVVDGQLLADPALVLDDIVVGPTAGLLGMALDPDFDRTRHVYIIYTARSGEGIEKQVVRYREVGGRLAERAALLSGIPATLTEDSAGLDIGPDGMLYVATGTAIDARRLESPTASAGQLLRLNPDGTTPRDNPAYSPIVLRLLTQPVTVAWIGETSTRVVIERASAPAGDLRMLRVSATPERVSVIPAPSAAASCRNSWIPEFRSDLFVAVPESHVLLRMRVDSKESVQGSSGRESLLAGRLGPIAVVACGQDGHLYLATRHAAAVGQPPDRIFRVEPR